MGNNGTEDVHYYVFGKADVYCLTWISIGNFFCGEDKKKFCLTVISSFYRYNPEKSSFTQKSFYNTHLELNSHLKLSEAKVFTPPL